MNGVKRNTLAGGEWTAYRNLRLKKQVWYVTIKRIDGGEKMNNSQNKNLLTEGSIWKKLMGFAFPLFLGNLFQQLYNTADSLIVGNFLGSDALAAVSSSGSLTFLLVGFFQGLAMGAGVIIARYFGARQKKELHRAIHTTVAFGILCGILLTAGGVVLAPKNSDPYENTGRYFAEIHPVFPGICHGIPGAGSL